MSPSVTVRLLGTQSDARLLELARGGHERAFEALVQRYRRPLLGYCRRVLLPEARAEDALQQALLQAWLALQRGDDVRDARAWLYRIVHNTALNALRGSGYDYAELSEAITGAGAPQEDLDRRIAVREALAGLAALPEAQREALLRTAVDGASHAAAAAEMGLSESALRGLVHRARVTLRAGLTAITPMPLATWAASAAGHGAGAVAEVAVGGGSAGVAGLLAKGGAAMLAAGVLAAGVGAVATTRHDRPHARPHPVRAARAAATVPPSRAVAAAGGSSVVPTSRAGGPGHRRLVALAPVSFPRAPEVPAGPRDGGSAAGGGGTAPRQGTSGGGDDRGGGTVPGERQGGAGTGSSTGGGDDGGSGAGGGSGDGHGGTSGGSSGGGGSGSSGSSGGDGGGTDAGSGDIGSSGDGTSGGSSGGGSGSSGGGASPGGSDTSTTTTSGGDG